MAYIPQSKDQTNRKLSSKELKTLLLAYLRFKRNFHIVATEAGLLASDVLCVDNKGRLLEYEIKVSWSDFLNDFKKDKHALFAGEKPESFCSRWIKTEDGYVESSKEQVNPKIQAHIPYHFTFLVTEDIADKVVKYIEEKQLPYGVMSANQFGVYRIRSPQAINNSKAEQLVVNMIIARMSSEIVNQYSKILELEAKV